MSLSAAIALILAQTASAASEPPPARPPRLPTKSEVEAQVKAHFAKIDLNGDGKVDREEAEKAHAAAVAEFQARRKKRIEETFAKLDADGDGQISRQEFEASVRSRPIPKESWFAATDIDRDGTVVLNEALAKALRAFEAIDINGNGVISSEELRASRQRRVSSN